MLRQLLSRIDLNIVDNIFMILLYVLIFIGFWIIFGSDFISLIKNTNKRFRRVRSETPNSKIIKHISSILEVLYNTEDISYSYLLVMISGLSFILCFLFIVRYNPIFFTLFTSVFFSIIPYLYFLTKLNFKRVSASHEALPMILELKSQYKLNNYNMIESIDKSIIHLEQYRSSKVILFKLAKKLKDAHDEEIKEVLNQFVFSIKTDWAEQLANLIEIAILEEVNIIHSLEDMITQIDYAKNERELEKRSNNESSSIINFFIPLAYIGTVIMSIKYFDFTAEKFFKYQFTDPNAFKFFVAMIILTISSAFILKYMENKKFDF